MFWDTNTRQIAPQMPVHRNACHANDCRGVCAWFTILDKPGNRSGDTVARGERIGSKDERHSRLAERLA